MYATTCSNITTHITHNHIFHTVRQRQSELHELKEFLVHTSPWREAVDRTQVFAAGFSYGAATASLEVVTHPRDYLGCLLLDGWFHIDVGDGFDFPQESHDIGNELQIDRYRLRVQAEELFVNSRAATRALRILVYVFLVCLLLLRACF
jgi:hypothetical protein